MLWPCPKWYTVHTRSYTTSRQNTEQRSRMPWKNYRAAIHPRGIPVASPCISWSPCVSRGIPMVSPWYPCKSPWYPCKSPCVPVIPSGIRYIPDRIPTRNRTSQCSGIPVGPQWRAVCCSVLQVYWLAPNHHRSQWNPSGIPVESQWNPSGIPVVSQWYPSGIPVVSQWYPSVSVFLW
jgi:hypothetical protein